MSRLITLSEHDRQMLREMRAKLDRLLGNTPNRPAVVEADPTAPEVYVAKSTISIAGINPASGTGTTEGYDEPQSGECQVYRVLNNGAGTPQLRPVDGLVRTVYNLSWDSVLVDTWFKVIRDKFGTWWVDDVCCTGTEPPPDSTVCGTCATTSDTYCVSFPGLTDDGIFCSQCDDFALENIQLTRISTCTWHGFSPLPICIADYEPDPGFDTAMIILTIVGSTANLEVYFGGVLVATYGLALAEWDCMTDTEFSGGSVQNTCDNWPAFIPVTIGTCPEPTTGTGGGSSWIDTFTDSDSTPLTSHTPDVSPGGMGYDPYIHGDLDIQTNKAAPATYVSSVCSAMFDPGLTACTFDIEVIIVDDTNLLFIQFGSRFDGIGASPTVSLQNLGGGSYTLSVSDGTASDSDSVSLSTATPYTMHIVVTATTVAATINGVTVNISSSENFGITTWLLYVNDAADTIGCVTFDDLSVVP